MCCPLYEITLEGARMSFLPFEIEQVQDSDEFDARHLFLQLKDNGMFPGSYQQFYQLLKKEEGFTNQGRYFVRLH